MFWLIGIKNPGQSSPQKPHSHIKLKVDTEGPLYWVFSNWQHITDNSSNLFPKVFSSRVTAKWDTDFRWKSPILAFTDASSLIVLNCYLSQMSLKATLSLWWILPPWAEILLCLSPFSALLLFFTAMYATWNKLSSHYCP